MADRKPAPDLGWIPFFKIGLGVVLIIMLASLAAVIGLGKVEQQTSFGLQDILGGLLVLCGGFAQWCFGGSRSDNKEDS